MLDRASILFTRKNGDFGAISVTERRFSAPISNVGEVFISESFLCRHERLSGNNVNIASKS